MTYPTETFDTGAEGRFRAFSSAAEPFPDRLAGRLAATTLARHWQDFRTRFGPMFDGGTEPGLDPEAAALARIVDGWIDAGLGCEDAWAAPLGRLAAALRDDDRDDPRAAVVSLALHLAARGRDIAWSGEMGDARGLLCGTTALPGGERLALHGANGQLRLAVDGLPVDLPAGPPEGLPFDVFPVADAIRACPMLAAELEPAPEAAATAALREAVELLACVPMVHEWVSRLIRAVAPLKSRRGRHPSRCFADRPGVIASACPARPAVLAELLVREASHQHFRLLDGFAPVVTGADARLYRSPAEHRRRPIAELLRSYHALGNVMILHRSLLAHGIAPEPDFSQRRCAQIAGQMPEIETALARSPGLSPAGQALWRPLARLAADRSEAHAAE